MSFAIGLKVLRRICEEQKPLVWTKSKLNLSLFNANERNAFLWVQDHFHKHHKLPQVETLVTMFPEINEVSTPEPTSYYVTLLENLYYFQKLNQANLESHGIMKEDHDAYDKAGAVLRKALNEIEEQKQRTHLLDVGLEAGHLVTQHYHTQHLQDTSAIFGWHYMDVQCGGGLPGDLISFVGRPASGKTYLSLWTALKNWRSGRNVLFVSMEMKLLPIAQRIAALYTGLPITQLKNSAFSSATAQKFHDKIQGLMHEKAKFFVMDGNLAASVEDIYTLADQLECTVIVIDGAYLVKHPNKSLNKFARVDANCELMKQHTTDLDNCTTFASWQFNREMAKKSKKTGKQETDLEDIGLSDSIGQLSSIVLGLTQEESVETLFRRNITVMKGREGALGRFSINWEFVGMNFDQCDPSIEGVYAVPEEYQWI